MPAAALPAAAVLGTAILACVLAAPPAGAAPGPRTIATGSSPSITPDGPSSALVTYLSSRPGVVKVCRVTAPSSTCVPVTEVTVPAANELGLRQLAPPSIVPGVQLAGTPPSWHLVVADFTADRTYVFSAADRANPRFGAAEILRDRAIASRTQAPLAGVPTGNTLTLFADPSAFSNDGQALVGRAVRWFDGRWGGLPGSDGGGLLASFRSRLATNATTAAALSGQPGQPAEDADPPRGRLNLVLVERESDVSARSCLRDHGFALRRGERPDDPTYAAQDPGLQAGWQRAGACFARGLRPSFAPGPDGQPVLMYRQDVPFGGDAELRFRRYSVSGSRQGPKPLRTALSRGRIGVTSNVLAPGRAPGLTALWLAGKGQGRSLAIARSRGGVGDGWSPPKAVAKVGASNDTVRGLTFAGGKGIAVWDTAGKVRIVKLPAVALPAE